MTSLNQLLLIKNIDESKATKSFEENFISLGRSKILVSLFPIA